MKKSLRVATIGGWGHWKHVLDELVGVDDIAVVGAAPAYAGESIDEVLRHPASAPAARFDDYRAMLRDLRPDVAVVSTRIGNIAQAAMDAIRGGCHLICEKPLALDVATLADFWQLVKVSGRQVLAMHNMRSLPAFRAAQSLVVAGRIGELVVANGRKSYKWLTRPEWFGRRAIYGGTIPWIGIHALDVMHYITGQSLTHVAAMHGNRTQPAFPECEDHVVMIVRLESGAHATISLDYCRPESAATHGDDWVRLVGARGVIEANASAGWCRLIEEGQGESQITLPQPDPMFRNFLLAVRDGNRYDYAMEDWFMLTHASLIARDAADRGVLLPVEWRPLSVASAVTV